MKAELYRNGTIQNGIEFQKINKQWIGYEKILKIRDVMVAISNLITIADL